MTLLATQITQALAARLATATTANGYTSNCGSAVFIGQTRGADRQAPAVFLLPGRQSGEGRYADEREVRREYDIRGFADLNSHPHLSEAALIDLIIWDLRRCCESNNDALTGLIERLSYRSDQPGYREEGGSIVGAALTYEIQYICSITDPTTPA